MSPARRWLAGFLVVVVVGIATLRPAIAGDDPEAAPAQVRPPPRQLTLVHRTLRGPLIAGVLMFGMSWGLTVFISLAATNGGCSGNCDSASLAWIPIAGPLAAAQGDDGPNPGLWFLFTAEFVGLALIIIGLAGHDVPVYRPAGEDVALSLAPLLTRDAGGMALTARW